MKNILDKLKKFVKGDKKNKPLKQVYADMQKEFELAEQAIGGNFFPKEQVLSTEEVHYKTMNLPVNTLFEDIAKQYKKLKSEYSLQNFEGDEEKTNEYIEKNARLDFAFAYFKSRQKKD